MILGSGRDVDQVLSSLEEHGQQLDGELRQIQRDIEVNKVCAFRKTIATLLQLQ